MRVALQTSGLVCVEDRRRHVMGRTIQSKLDSQGMPASNRRVRTHLESCVDPAHDDGVVREIEGSVAAVMAASWGAWAAPDTSGAARPAIW